MSPGRSDEWRLVSERSSRLVRVIKERKFPSVERIQFVRLALHAKSKLLERDKDRGVVAGKWPENRQNKRGWNQRQRIGKLPRPRTGLGDQLPQREWNESRR